MNRTEALMKAAQAWGADKTSKYEMNADLAEAFADILQAELASQEQVLRQWFYKNDDCKASYSSDDDCICWNDEDNFPKGEDKGMYQWRNTSPQAQADDNFDTWLNNHYTKVLNESIKNDYVPKAQPDDEIDAVAFVTMVQNSAGIEAGIWGDEWLAWYEKEKWLNIERALAVFIGKKLAQPDLQDARMMKAKV
jgi:hypothetical protein